MEKEILNDSLTRSSSLVPVPDVMVLMQELSPKRSDLVSECVRREGEKDAVDLKVWLAENPLLWFVVRYRDTGPLLLLTMNGFMDGVFWEDSDDTGENPGGNFELRELRSMLEELLETGYGFLEQRPEPTGWFFPKLTIHISGLRDRMLRLPLGEDLQNFVTLKWLRRQGPGV